MESTQDKLEKLSAVKAELDKLNAEKAELEYIRESMTQEGVLVFYIDNMRYFISVNYKNRKWTLVKCENGVWKELREYANLDEVFKSEIINGKTIKQLLIVEHNDYEFV